MRIHSLTGRVTTIFEFQASLSTFGCLADLNRFTQNMTSPTLTLPDDSPAFTNFKNGNETELTYELKWAAWRWLWEEVGCRSIGFEVRLEGPFGRIAAVVGLGPGSFVYLIEVKSSRSDAKRDDNNERSVKRLQEKKSDIESSVELARAINVQTETSSRPADDLIRSEEKLTRVEKRLETISTKFNDPAYLRCADYHYLVTQDRLLRTTEIPDQWGLLNERGEVIVEAPKKQVKRVTSHVLRAIARANTRDLMKAVGVKVERRERSG